MSIRGIFFDAADVFYERDESSGSFIKRLLLEHGYAGELSPESRARERELNQQANRGLLAPEAYWHEVLALYGVSSVQERNGMVEKIVARVHKVRAIPGGRETMRELKRRGFMLGIVTDTIYPIEWKMSWLKKAGVADFIDVVACSSTLGSRKPDPAIYLDAVQQAKLTVAESCFVGHDAGELAGARRVGLATVAVRHDPHAQADYFARTLPDLLNVPIFNQQQGVQPMNHAIEAIFLDVGNTLRLVQPDAPFQAQARRDLMALVGTTESEQAFFAGLEERWSAYRKQSKASLVEASGRELWTKWLLPAYPPEQIAPLAGKLTRLWRDRDGRRVPREDAKPVILELHRRGYRLGIIANTITETEIPDWLAGAGLTDYISAMVLSSKVAYRKPDPRIYWEAARRIGVEAAGCAYVGDNLVRDVEGTRLAGFGLMIIILEPATIAKEPPTGDNKPDHIIHELSELLDIFPARS